MKTSANNFLFKTFILLATLGSSAIAHGLQNKLEDGFRNCSNIVQNEKRLACFDSLRSILEAGINVDEGAPNTEQHTSQAQLIETTKNKVQLSETQYKQKQIQSIESTSTGLAKNEMIEANSKPEKTQDSEQKTYGIITKVSMNSRKLRTITLSNGQVWRQQSSKFIDISEGDEVYVRKGLFGSFHLSTDKINRSIRVKRSK